MTHVCAVYSPLCLIRGTRDRNGAPLHPAPIGAGAARANGNTARNVHGPALATPHLADAVAAIRI